MNSTRKILTVVLIIIIIVAIGAAAYIYEQNTKTGTQPTPTPTLSPTPTVNATVIPSGQTFGIGIGGNITKAQISNVTITPSQATSTTVIFFNVTGQGGSGFSNMTIPKAAISYGTNPVVYIENAQAQDQGFVQDTNNFYVWFTTHFSTHQITITFTTTQSSPTPYPTSNPTASPTPYSSPTQTLSPTTLTVSTTTSLHDTGLEDIGINVNTTGTIKAAFEAKYPWITINFLAQGTGAAIQTAQRGDADMILVHSPSQEATFLSGGYGVDRKIIAYNFFVIVGPANDSAGISGMTNVSQALRQLYTSAQTNSQIQWFTRNDGSGTTTAETTLWKNAGYTYTTLVQNTSWFHSTGLGMGITLQEASNGIGGGPQGYCLSDTGTYLAFSSPSNAQPITLKIEIQAQQALLNVYSAIIDNPQSANLNSINFNAALTFVNWLVSNEGQQLIANYGISTYGQPLFTPFVPLVGYTSNITLLGWIQSYAYMSYNTATNTISINPSGTECPTQYRYNAGNLYAPFYDALVNMNLNASISLPNYYTTYGQQISPTLPVQIQTNSKVNRA